MKLLLIFSLLILSVATPATGANRIKRLRTRPCGEMLYKQEQRDIREKKTALRMKVQQGHPNIESITISKDDRYALTTGQNSGSIKLWEIATGTLVRDYASKTPLKKTFFSSNRKKILAVNHQNRHIIWTTKLGKHKHSFTPFKTAINNTTNEFLLNDNRRILLTGRDQKSVEIWFVGKRHSGHRKLRTFQTNCTGSDGRMALLGISPNEDFFVTGCRNNSSVIAWDIKTGDRLWQTKALAQSPQNSQMAFVFLTDSNQFVFAEKGDASHQFTLSLFSSKSGKRLNSYGINSEPIKLLALSNSQSILIISKTTMGSKISRLNLQSGSISPLSVNQHFPEAITITHDGKHILGQNKNNGQFQLLDAHTGEVIRVFKGNNTVRKRNISASFNNWHFTDAPGDGHLYVWDGESASLSGIIPLTGKYKHNFPFKNVTSQSQLSFVKKYLNNLSIQAATFSPDGKYLAVLGTRGSKRSAIEIWHLKKKKRTALLQNIPGTHKKPHPEKPFSLHFSKNGNYLVSLTHALGYWNTHIGTLITTLDKKLSPTKFSFLPDGKRAVILDSGIALWDLQQSKLLHSYPNATAKFAVAVSPDGTRVVSDNDSNGLRVWNTQTGRGLNICWHNFGHEAQIDHISFLPGNRHVVTSSQAGIMRIWNIDDGESVAFTAQNNEWIIFTQDGYFDASRKGGRLVSALKGIKGYGIDQIATRYNRPDVILERIQLGTPKLIDHYRNLFKRRVQKLGLKEAQLEGTFENAPLVKIDDIQKRGKTAEVSFSVSDTVSKLHSYHIYVNNVPIFGVKGKPLSGNKQHLKTTVTLTSGTNKIEVSAINKLGMESLRDNRTIEYTQRTQSNLYYLGFGVSKYRDASLNLKYAAKDVTDIKRIFEKATTDFNAVFSRTYTNEQVTKQAIEQARTFLKDATEDDTVVLFVAGHGLYATGSSSDYFYLTHRSQLNNLRETAAHFDQIENLLQGIKPRQKLFLMDTCQSGELDNAMEASVLSSAQLLGLQSRGIRKKKLVQSNLLSNNYAGNNRERFIYNNMHRRSGAIVLSSSRGSEWSYENDRLKNGVFTEEIINALTSKIADTNRDNKISTQEIRTYVSTAVAQSTKGLQHPSVDRDNLEIEFTFPIVPAQID